jgi:CubicO group peptidase (beta-lactamase class C family)
MHAEVQDLLEDLVDSGRELGVQVAACLNGELVVDTWAGVADSAGHPVDGQTLFPVFSVSKGIAATAVHLLVDRGLLRYDVRIAELWPEFGAHGKDKVTLAHVLEHSAGVPFFPAGLAPDDLADEDEITALIADQRLAWEPGTRTGYHSLTFGYLVDRAIRGATGRTLEAVIRDEIAVPLGLEDDLFITPPDVFLDRLAEVDDTGFDTSVFPDTFQQVVGRIDVGSIVPRRTAPPGRSWAASARLPFAATMTARAGARLYGVLATGGAPLLSAETLAEATRIRRRDVDFVVGVPVLKSYGYSHGDEVTGGLGAAFGFGGLGGSEAYADPTRGFSFAFTHNRLTMVDSAPEVASLVRKVLGSAAFGDAAVDLGGQVVG